MKIHRAPRITAYLILVFAACIFAAAQATPPTSAPQTSVAQEALNVPQNIAAPVLNNAPAIRIGGGDLLEVSVLGTDFTKQVRVDGEGDISLPMLSEVKVAGLTVHQVEQLIAKNMSDGGIFNDPQVSVVQKEYSTQGISVLGEVQKPGIYPLLGAHTLLEAISAAGGTTLKAGNDVSILHASNPETAVHVNVSKLDRSNVPVLPGDTIVVSRAGIVYVVGDVKLPSGIVMENTGLTVLKALAMAQGVNPTASLDHSKLIRNTPQGRQEYPLELKKIFANKAPDVPLQPDDILFIPNSAAKSAARRGLEAVVQTATGVAIYRPY